MVPRPPPPARSSFFPTGLWWLLPFLVGLALRVHQVSWQLLLDDEFHAVRTALAWDLPKILTTYRPADHCIPLTALYRAMAGAGLPLSEWTLKAPVLLAGTLTPLVFPLALRRELGRGPALALSWLLAVAPSLLFYSRIARPYAIVALLAPLAVACLWRWWEGGGWGWGLAYAGSGALTGWFHLGALPLVLGPAAYAGAVLVLRRLRGVEVAPRLQTLVVWVGLLGALIASFLLPAHSSFVRVLESKSGAGALGLGTLGTVLKLQAGSIRLWVVLLFWALAGVGLTTIVRRRPGFGTYTCVAVASQLLALWLVRPFAIQVPFVLNRYLLVALPFVLLWVALGYDRLTCAARRLAGRGLAWVCAAALPVALAVTHPYVADPALRFGPFAGSVAAVQFAQPPPRIPPEEVPSVYRILAAEGGVDPVLEAPSGRTSRDTLAEQALARVHGRRVILAVVESDLPRARFGDPRLALDTLTPVDPAAFLASRARFLVVHTDRGRFNALARESLGHRRRQSGFDRLLAEEGRLLARRLERTWGEPHLSTASVRVWDLARVRPARELE